VAEKRQWIEWDHPAISIREQCRLLGLHRSNLYYAPVPETQENLDLMRMIDEEYMRHPFKGQRQMVSYLDRQGIHVNRKRIKRLMKNMGLEAIAPKPKTTIPSRENKVYPYLLRGLEIAKPDQVWCSDITYVPVRYGFLYLCAVMDWHSRFVLSWKLSNSMDTSLVIETLDEALEKGRPEIFNTDQGSQFTSREFTSKLTEAAIEISMDGRGRATDNVFIERLWRTVKYEEIYLKEYSSGVEINSSLSRFFDYYDYNRPHQGLDNQTPWEVYRPKRKKRPAGAI
jgi:putative transposase